MFGLQKEFEKSIKELSSPKSVLLSLLSRRFDEFQITLTETQQEELSNQILKLKKGTIQIEFGDDQVKKAGFSNEEELAPYIQEIFKNLGNDIENFMVDYEKELPETIQNIVSDIAPTILNSLKQTASKMLIERHQDEKQFQENLFSIWGDAIDLLEMFLVMNIEIGEYNNQKWMTGTEDVDNNFLMDVLSRLHARACQIVSEIIVLLKNGFADGAHARWRTLHEITVISKFIADHGNELAEKYLLFENIESYKAAIQYQEYSDKLGLEKISKNEFDEIVQKKDELLTRFGKDYKNDYGWAASVLDKTNPNFSDIEKTVDLDYLRPYYKIASYNVHANPKGVFFKLGILDDEDILLAGPSNIGLIEPGRSAVSSLLNITINYLIEYEATVDTLVISQMLLDLQEKIEGAFCDAHDLTIN